MMQKYGDCIFHLPTTSRRSRSHTDTRQSTTSNQLSPLEPPTRLINNYNNFTSLGLRCLIINCHTFLRSRWTRMNCTKTVFINIMLSMFCARDRPILNCYKQFCVHNPQRKDKDNYLHNYRAVNCGCHQRLNNNSSFQSEREKHGLFRSFAITDHKRVT